VAAAGKNVQAWEARLEETRRRLADLSSERTRARQALKPLSRRELSLLDREVVLGERRMRAAAASRVDAELETLSLERAGLEADRSCYEEHIEEAYRSEFYQTELKRLSVALDEARVRAKQRERACRRLREDVDPARVEALAGAQATLSEQLGAQRESLRSLRREKDRLVRRVTRQQSLLKKVERLRSQAAGARHSRAVAGRLEQLYRSMASPVADLLRARAAREAAGLYEAVARDDGELIWLSGYGLALRRRGRLFGFASLSRGEQTTAAVAARLALLRQLPGFRLVLLDEPTAWLDAARRQELARALGELARHASAWAEQIVVVSHDDAFESVADRHLTLRPSPEGSSAVC
jgi:DNA repair exonuclease SbcCD ATPase subunit